MSSRRVGNWVQLITVIAVLIGLILVVWELQQARELSRGQLVSDAFATIIAKDIAQLGENFSRTRARACLEPTNLTNTEVFEMRAYHRILLTEITSIKDNSRVLSDSSGSYWRRLAELNLREMLSTKAGRITYERGKAGFDPDVRQIAEDLISSGNVVSCEQIFAEEVKKNSIGIDPRT